MDVAVKRFTCGGCGFSSKVEVTSPGASPTSRDADPAAGWADYVVLLCACPRCNWLHPHAMKRKKRVFQIGGLSLGLLLLGAASILAGVRIGGGILVAIGLVGAILAAMNGPIEKRLRDVVRFVPDTPPGTLH
jgi:hypothetical protein